MVDNFLVIAFVSRFKIVLERAENLSWYNLISYLFKVLSKRCDVVLNKGQGHNA